MIKPDLHTLLHEVGDEGARYLVPLGVDQQAHPHPGSRCLPQQVQAGQGRQATGDDVRVRRKRIVGQGLVIREQPDSEISGVQQFEIARQ